MEPFEIEERTAVRFIRLNNGEDLVAETTEFKAETEHYYILTNPMKIVYSMMSGMSSVGILLMNWVFPRISDSTEFVIYPQDVLTMGYATKDIELYYFQQLDKIAQMKVGVGISAGLQNKAAEQGKPSFDDYPDDDEDDDEEEYSPEEMDYVKKMLNDIKLGKRKPH